MKAESQNLNYLNNVNKIKVPFFQRPYVWNETNWEELYESIKDSNGKMPFIGSFIFQDKTENNYYVIDGQQRLTTLFIFIKCVYDLLFNNLKGNKLKTEIKDDYKAQLKKIYLSN